MMQTAKISFVGCNDLTKAQFDQFQKKITPLLRPVTKREQRIAMYNHILLNKFTPSNFQQIWDAIEDKSIVAAVIKWYKENISMTTDTEVSGAW